MSFFVRYPHVKELAIYYSNFFSDPVIPKLLNVGVQNQGEAEHFARFVWKMIDQMRLDTEASVEVLGCIDNSEMLQDIYYDVSSFMAVCGYESIWEKVSEDA